MYCQASFASCVATNEESDRQKLLGARVFCWRYGVLEVAIVCANISSCLCQPQTFSYKYYEPFEILKHIGDVAYKLKLSESTAIHPVIHVSQLKSSLRSHCPISASILD
jgi:hypothetical protein